MKKTAPSGQEKRSLGRPRRPIEMVRRNRVVTMVTDAELQEIVAIAEKDGSSVSAVLHQVLMRFLNRKHLKE